MQIPIQLVPSLLLNTMPRRQRVVATDNYVHDNGDAGMALLESFGAEVSGNTFEDNKYGVRLSVGCGNNVFSNNVISGSSQ